MNQPAVGDNATPGIASRRGLLGASAIGAAVALLAGRAADASVGPWLSDDDRQLLRSAMELEVAARDLYDAASAAGAESFLLEPMSEQHEAYAQVLAGMTGIPVSDVQAGSSFQSALSGFDTSDTSAALRAAYDLESAAVATHLETLGQLTDVDAAKAVASIVAMESRHATVLAHATGRGDDLDAMLSNDAEPITSGEAS